MRLHGGGGSPIRLANAVANGNKTTMNSPERTGGIKLALRKNLQKEKCNTFSFKKNNFA